MVDAVFLDLPKSFDIVNHNIIITEMYAYEIIYGKETTVQYTQMQ